MTVPAILLSACLVQGQVLETDGTPLGGVDVVDPQSGTVLTVTASTGAFSAQAPDGSGGDVALEFRLAEYAPAVHRVPCGSTLEITLLPLVFEMPAFEIRADRLEGSSDVSSVRTDELDERTVTEAAGASPSLSQAVQQLPGVGAVGRDGYTSAPTIRGLGRDRSIMLLEGVRLSSDRGVGPSGSFLDPFLLQSVDIIRGPSGVAYGSGAIGGVISVGLGPATEQRSAIARLAGSTNGRGRLVAGRLGGSPGGEWRSTFGGFLRGHDDYSFPSGPGAPGGDAVNSGFENGGLTLALENPTGGGMLRISGLATRAKNVGRATTQPNRLDSIEQEDHVLTAVRFSRDVDRKRVELAVGTHRPATDNRTERFDDAGNPTRVGVITNESWDGTLSGLTERPLGIGSWLAGLDVFTRLNVDASEKTIVYLPSGVPGSPSEQQIVSNGTRLDLGAFGGWKHPVRTLGQFIAAVRLDWAYRNADGQPSSSWVAPSVNLGLVYPLGSEWNLTVGAARAFRAPRIQELYFEGDRPGGARLANPGLEPETAWSGEAGVKWSRGPWSAAAAGWGLVADDLIVQLPVDAAGDTLRNENVATGKYLGMELGLYWSPEGGRGTGSITYALIHGETDDSEPLPDVPPGEIRFAGEWRIYQGMQSHEVRVRSALRAGAAKTPVPGGADEKWWSPILGSTAIGGDEVGHPGYSRWDLGVRWRANRLAVIDASVVNVLDTLYLDRAEANAYPQPGRSFLLELTVGE